MTHTAYIALGSNLGNRHENLRGAVERLRAHPDLRLGRVSSFFETRAVGGPAGQAPYLNAVVQVQTNLDPQQLLKILLEVERSFGRVRGERNLPRTLDLDLLLYGDLVLAGPELCLPHPRLQERWFVLAPLAEIAPDLVHPCLGLSMAALLENLVPDETTGGPVALPAASVSSAAELAGLRALVTGATGGIGRAMALELALAGADVIVHGRRSEAAQAVVDQARQRGVDSHYLLADLHSPDECHQLIQAAFPTGARLDIWINNAGADILTSAAGQWDFWRKLRALFEVDVAATMLLSREVGRRMKEQGRGVIINMGWDKAQTGMEGDSGQLFAAAKAAVMAFSKSLALSLAPEVRVNCLAPGWVRTAWGEKASSVWQERVRRETPLGRWGNPEDVARTARWLVSPAASFITGQVICVNGGAVR